MVRMRSSCLFSSTASLLYTLSLSFLFFYSSAGIDVWFSCVDAPISPSLSTPVSTRSRRKSSNASKRPAPLSPTSLGPSEGGDDAVEGDEDDDDDFGDDFDDFEEGGNDDDFGDFDDGFQQVEETPPAPPPPAAAPAPAPAPAAPALSFVSLHCPSNLYIIC